MALDRLRTWVTLAVVALVVVLCIVNVIDDMGFGDRWAGPPGELFAALGGIIGGLYAPAVLTMVRGNNGSKDKTKGGQPA